MLIENRDKRITRSLTETVSFDFLGKELGSDLNAALALALDAGAVFSQASTPLALFRHAIAETIGRLAGDVRWDLFRRFLKYGPQDVDEAKPGPERLSRDETATVVAFIWSHSINCFQGAIAELLATAPCTRILRTLQQEGRWPENARLYVGDAVLPRRTRGSRHAKGADVHLLAIADEAAVQPTVTLLGVGEVKSYFCREDVLWRQLAMHCARARRGLRIGGKDCLSVAAGTAHVRDDDMAKIAVLPSRWRLQREFRHRRKDGRKVLEVATSLPPTASDKIIRLKATEWRVELRWSKEALAAAAYEMTQFLMSRIGEILYEDGVPPEWSEMTPAEAGYNSVKEKLYYAIHPYVIKADESNMPGKVALTRKEVLAMQRAIALYNSYCFGYALGSNFRDREGKREMLWPEDLDEILAQGETKFGCRIR